MKKRVLKKGVIKFFIVLIIIIILAISGLFVYKYYTSDLYKLTKLGYDKEISKEIISLGKSEKVLSLEYNEKMIDILKSTYYLDKNLEKYIEYYNSHKDTSIVEIITIINTHIDNKFYSLKLETDLSKGNAMIVNKFYSLNKDYNPDNLVNVKNWYAYGEQKIIEEVYDNYIEMFNAAKKENLTLIINDSYRTYEEQEKTHKRYGDDYAARAGSSEHNTGLAIDVICPGANGDNFDKTKEFEWLQNHAHEYGFILRYPKDKENITGYSYESWHYRYLGRELATKVRNSGLTYEEYYAYYIESE